MKNNLKNLFLWVIDVLGINSLFRIINRHRALILWYHGISDDSSNLSGHSGQRHVRKSLFIKQINYLKKKGYVFKTISELVAMIKNQDNISKVAVLTFDDGFSNIIYNAYPVMKQFNAKGCFYLVSNIIGGKKLLWTDNIDTIVRNQKKGEFKFVFQGNTVRYSLSSGADYDNAMKDIKKKLRQISNTERIEHMRQFDAIPLENIPEEFTTARWEDIINCNQEILEMGSHTANHPDCTKLTSEQEFQDECLRSKSELEKMVGYEINNFSYPAGDYNPTVINKLRAYGYQSAVTIIDGFNDKNTDLFQLRRVAVNENLLYFKASVSGVLYVLMRWRNALAG